MTEGSAIGLIAALAVLLALSAYFSATETAFTGLSKARMKRMAERSKGARLALKLGENYNRILSTLLIGNNIVNIAAASLATLVFTFYFGDLGVTLSTVVMTVLVLIFGEISPKSLARERPEEFAAFAARPLYVCTLLFAPLNFLFDGWKKLLNKLFRLDKKRPSMTEEEFMIIVSDIRDEGVLTEAEHDVIQNALKYDETQVFAAMTPMARVTAVEENARMEDVKALFEESNYSRVPVYRGDTQHILGILYRADFYELMLNGGEGFAPVVKPVYEADADETLSALLARMQRERRHMAVVKRGEEILGLITLEDILEELVGEIDDRFDAEQPAIM